MDFLGNIKSGRGNDKYNKNGNVSQYAQSDLPIRQGQMWNKLRELCCACALRPQFRENDDWMSDLKMSLFRSPGELLSNLKSMT